MSRKPVGAGTGCEQLVFKQIAACPSANKVEKAGKAACGYAPLAPFIERAERRGNQARPAWRFPL